MRREATATVIIAAVSFLWHWLLDLFYAGDMEREPGVLDPGEHGTATLVTLLMLVI